MKKILGIFALCLSSVICHLSSAAQSTNTIYGDTVTVDSRGGNATLKIKNATRAVPGFLYNTGNGVTAFKRGAIKLNDTAYLVGSDTIVVPSFLRQSVADGLYYPLSSNPAGYLTAVPGLQTVTDIDNTTTNDLILRNAYLRLRWPGWTMSDYKQFGIGRNNDTLEVMTNYEGNYNVPLRFGVTTYSGQQHLDASARYFQIQQLAPFTRTYASSVLTGSFNEDLAYMLDSGTNGTQTVRNVIGHNKQYLRPGITNIKAVVLQAQLINDTPRTTPVKIFNVNEDGTNDWFSVHAGGKVTAKNVPYVSSTRFATIHNDTLKQSTVDLAAYDSLRDTRYINSFDPSYPNIQVNATDRQVLKNMYLPSGTNMNFLLPAANSLRAGTVIWIGDNNTGFNSASYGIVVKTTGGDHFGNTSETETPVHAVKGGVKWYMTNGIDEWTYDLDGIPYNGATQNIVTTHDIKAATLFGADGDFTNTVGIHTGDYMPGIVLHDSYMETFGSTGRWHGQWSGHGDLFDFTTTTATLPALKVTGLATGGSSQYLMADNAGNVIWSGVFNTTAYVPDLPALAAIVTSATSMNVGDSLQGGLFIKTDRNGDADYVGMRISVSGEPTKVWRRFVATPNIVELTWLGAKRYNPYDPSTKVSCHTAANLATNWFPNRNGLVDINGVFYTNQPILYGEGTVFKGTNTLFPLQTNPDTIRYRSQSAIWFDSTNCFEPDMGVVSYRNQKPAWEKIGIFFAGPLTNTYFGILFKNNTNSTASLNNVGLASNTDCYIYGAHVGVGNNDYSNLSSDSYVWRGGQISFCDTAIVMGKSGNYAIELDSYGNKVGVKTNGNNNKILNSTFEYGYLGNSADTSSIGIIHNSTKDEIAGNICNFMGKFLKATSNASRSNIHDNGMLQTNNTTITLDSAASLLEIIDNNFVTTTQNPMSGKYFIYGYKSADIKISGGQMTSSSGSLTIAGTFDTCSGTILLNPHTKGLQSPDNKNFVFNGGTSSSQFEFQNKGIQGNLFLTDNSSINLLSSGKLAISQDSSTIPTVAISSAQLAGTPAYDVSVTKSEGRANARTGLSSGSVLFREHYKFYTSSGSPGGDRMVFAGATTEATTTSAAGGKIYAAVAGQGSTSMNKGYNLQGTSSATRFWVGDTATLSPTTLGIGGDLSINTVSNGAAGDSMLVINTNVVKKIAQSQMTGISPASIQGGAYNFYANNTSGAANMTAQNFRSQASQQLDTTTFTWTGTTPPNTNTGRTYSWQQVGNMVTVRINVVYSVAGSSLTALAITLPSDMPAPAQPSGFTAASDVISEGSGHLNASKAAQTATSTAGIRRNAGNTAFEFYIINGAATNATNGRATITYFTN